MEPARPEHATPFEAIDQPHAEVIDPTTREVWQSLAPCDAEALAGLDLPPPMRPLGVGCAAMDEHWFDRSPGAAEDGPMRLRTLDGLVFGHCARPASAPETPFGKAGPTRMRVDKHHALRFRAGRRVLVLRDPVGDHFVHVIAGLGTSSIGVHGTSPERGFEVPERCRVTEIRLERDWVLRLPHPTEVFFFPSGDSFQGPIQKPGGAGRELS
jgi:hypothetical protein